VTAVLERQRWLGALALAVAVPLPFTGVVSPPFLLPFVALAAAALLARRPLPPLRPWLENVLAPLIVVLVVAAGGMRFGVLRPVAQLAVLLAAVRLPGGGQRSRTLTTAGLIALIGIAGVASSTHPLLGLYLVALLAFVVTAVGRMEILFHAEAARGGGRPGWPPARLVIATVALAVVVAAPLFVLLPRLRSPFAAAPFGSRPVSGFRDAVALHQLGTVKLSQALALEIAFDGRARPDPEWLRLVGATVRHYRAGSWAEGKRSRRLLRAGEGVVVRLAEPVPGIPVERAEITLRKDAESLFAPAGTFAIELPDTVPVWRDMLGSLTIPRGTEMPVRYAVSFQPGRVEQPPPDGDDLTLPPGAAPVRALAAEVARDADNPLAVALAFESHLRTAYRYSATTNAPVRADPVQWFLFASREGHCEFFASSMVLMLRSVGVPARLQAGYAGGDPDGEGGFLVRDSHAHAWVVAWVGDRWRVFDPTPSEGRPGLGSELGGFDLALGWQRLEAGWDRWVLTFSLADQVDLSRQVVDALRAASGRWLLVLGGAAGALLLAALLRRLVPRLGALRRRRVRGLSAALERIGAEARRRGVVGDAELTPQALERAVSTAAPAGGSALRWLVSRHERWCYAGGEAPARGEVRRATRTVARALDRLAPRPGSAPPGSGRSAGTAS
jgi:protein-glutamine gamma-glutamyltransferase